MIGFNDLIAQLNLPTIWRGLAWGPFTIQITNPDGSVVNLTGKTPYAKTPSFTLNPSLSNPSQGIMQVQLTAVTTATLPMGNYPYDVTVSTYTKPWFQGYVPVKQPVSQQGL